MAREINLIPDVKGEMIKALKLRNFIFFICIVVTISSIVVTAVFASIAGGQQAIADGKIETINELSNKTKSYSDLSDFLTIKDQLGNISTISSNKKLLSRTFTVLSALIPTGPDTITISGLRVNLQESDPVFSFDAQANAGKEPYIDYNVLDSFKKSMDYMRYDYGTYVDKNGNGIPSYCIIENGTDGASFYDSKKGSYAYWLINGEGCNPSVEDEEDTEKSDDEEDAKNDENVNNTKDTVKSPTIYGYTPEQYEGQTVVRIWRTPQYDDWYKAEQKEGEPYMSLTGEISNVAHFNSECIAYTGTIGEKDKKPTWTESNDCMLVPGGSNGINVGSSTNGRGSSSELVLRFDATIVISAEVFNFNNKHVMAIPPSGRHNVTDSYVQIQNMFEERAVDCTEDDTACKTENKKGDD